MIAIIFHIGQGFETPAQVTGLLEILEHTPEPEYDMACAPDLYCGTAFSAAR